MFIRCIFRRRNFLTPNSPLLNKFLIFLVFGAFLIFSLNLYKNNDFLVSENSTPISPEADLLTSKYLQLFKSKEKLHINNKESKCRLPILDPWDPTILEYLRQPQASINCKPVQYELTFIDDRNFLRFNKTVLSLAGFSDENLDCSYRYWKKINLLFNSQVCTLHLFRCFDKNDDLDDVTLNETKWFNLSISYNDDGHKIPCEFIEIYCSRKWSSSMSVYSNFHAKIIPKSLANEKPTTKNTKTDNFAPNILLFAIDSMSRSNFLRYLPKFVNVLNDSDYRSIFINGFVKVGDNSFPNAAALLTGLQYSHSFEFYVFKNPYQQKQISSILFILINHLINRNRFTKSVYLEKCKFLHLHN